eukprot:6050076-Amphidinium_carterae.1
MHAFTHAATANMHASTDAATANMQASKDAATANEGWEGGTRTEAQEALPLQGRPASAGNRLCGGPPAATAAGAIEKEDPPSHRQLCLS